MKEETYAFAIASTNLRGDIIGIAMSVLRDGAVIHQETKRAAGPAEARFVVRTFLSEWNMKLFAETGDFGRPRLVSAHRGH